MSVIITFYCKQCKQRSEVHGFKDLGDFFKNYVCSCGYQPNPKEYNVLTLKKGDLIRYVLLYKKVGVYLKQGNNKSCSE